MKLKDKIKQKEAGFSIIEMMVTMMIFFFILWGLYSMVSQYGQTTRTEQARVRLSQESRGFIGFFSEELKKAGSALTITYTQKYNMGGDPFFNGIYPLNNTDFADGIIVASGDPDAMTSVHKDYEFSSGDQEIYVKTGSVNLPMPDGLDVSKPEDFYKFDTHPWTAGDRGIIIGKDGYLVFRVTEVDRNNDKLTIRDDPIYYSGLLNCDHYQDVQATQGNAVTYPGGSPVIRLSSFSIYVFREVTKAHLNRNIRQLIRVTDAHNTADVFQLISQYPNDASIISENIWNLQISYILYNNFGAANQDTAIDPGNQYFALPGSATDLGTLMANIRTLALKQIDIRVVSITDQLAGENSGSQNNLSVPRVFDYDKEYLSGGGNVAGKYSYRIQDISVEPKNYNIIRITGNS